MRVPPGLVVAIDGPSGAGKSSVSRAVASRLGLRYLDTGAMYRALTWQVLSAGLDPDDAQAVAATARSVLVEVGTAPSAPTVSVDGRDVAAAIRGAQVSAAVSAVSAVPDVRAVLVARQRALIGAGDIVVEGRDIGTVVAPYAAVKIFLTASSAARAQRRAGQALSSSDVELVQRALDRRDRLDSTRSASPLLPAADAVLLDTTELSQERVVQAVVARCLAATEQVGSEALQHDPNTAQRAGR
ncbi:MAG: (d)CMP kinase [Actinomycetota bacterium]|nr:(d)CMP kinase [Actinomycetota bacterium]